jgi:hypothetical protein
MYCIFNQTLLHLRSASSQKSVNSFSSCLAYKALETNKENKRKPTKQTRATRNTSDPLTSPNALEWSLLLLYWMQCVECLDVWSGGGWGVFIALNHQTTVGGLLSMGTPDSPVRQPRHPTVRVRPQSTFGALSSSGTRQVLFTVQCASGGCSDFCVHCPHIVVFAGVHCSRSLHW